MTPEEARDVIVEDWIRKADVSLESAAAEFAAGRFDFAVNRIYDACFYAANAALLAAKT